MIGCKPRSLAIYFLRLGNSHRFRWFVIVNTYFHVVSVVPEPDYWLGPAVFVAQYTQARCAEEKVLARYSIEPEPASDEIPAENAR
jgi:hypothetical protein